MKTLLRKPAEPAKLADSTSAQISELRDHIASLRERKNEAKLRQEELFRELQMARASSPVEALSQLLTLDAMARPADALGSQKALAETQLLLEGVDRAIKINEQRLLQLQAEEDAQACREVLPTHRRNVRETVNAVLRLHRAIAAQDELRMDLNRRGVERTGQLVPLYPFQFRDGLNDPNSWLSVFMRNAVDGGFCSEQERVDLMRGDLNELHP